MELYNSSIKCIIYYLTIPMFDYKTLFDNILMLERFMSVFAIDPNTTKNQKIVKELLDYGKIAA